MAISDYLANALLDHQFGKAVYTPPTAIKVHLSTDDPLDDGSGIAEPSGNGYLPVTTAAGDWTAAAARVTTNANTLTFPTPTGSWGTLRYFYLTDESDNLLGSGALPRAIAVDLGTTAPSFAAGALRQSYAPEEES